MLTSKEALSVTQPSIQDNLERMKAFRAQGITLLCIIVLISADPEVCNQCSCNGNRTDCSNRGLTAVPSSWLNSTVWIDLSHNQITSVDPLAFLGLNLIYLDLSWNAILSLSDSSFIGLSALLHLNLNENPLPYDSGFTDGVFAPLVKLKELYLLTNDCPTLPPDQYVQGLATLETLAIVATKKGRIGEKLGLLRSLDTLMLSSRQCDVRTLDPGDMRSIALLPLRRLSLRNSRLQYFDPAFLRYFNRTLTKLDLSCNSLDNLSSIIEAVRGTKLDTLLLDAAADYFLSVDMSMAFFSALRSTPLRILSVARNRYLQISVTENWASYWMPQLRYLRLGYNQLILNSLVKLDVGIGASIALFYNLKVLDISGLFTFDGRQGAGQHESMCREHDPLFSDEKQPWEDDQLLYRQPDFLGKWLVVTVLRLLLKNELTLPPVLTRLYATDLGGLFVKYSCHDRKINFMNNVKIVDLSRATLEDLECDDSGLGSVIEYRIGQVGLKRYNPSYFSLSSMPMLRNLDLHGNELGSFIDSLSTRGALIGVSGIQHLDVSANGITIMNAEILYGLDNVTTMNFSRNSIHTWNAKIASMHQLRLLDLSSNQLNKISKAMMAELDAHALKVPDFVVNLSSNPFACSCDNVDLLKWMVNTKVIHYATSCSYGSGTMLLDTRLLRVLHLQCFSWAVIVIALSVVLVLMIPIVLSYACKWRFRYMYYKCKRLCRREDRSWLVDAVGVFVSYHQSDASIAMKMRSYLESHIEKVTIVTRSLVALGQYELEQVAALIEDCNVSIILISPEGLNDPKFEFEFFMASEKGPHSILPIITSESLELSCLPRALRKLLISNSYLRFPGGLTRDANGDFEEQGDPRLQQFLIIFETSLLNIIERQTIRRLRNKPSRVSQRPNVGDNSANNEERPLVA